MGSASIGAGLWHWIYRNIANNAMSRMGDLTQTNNGIMLHSYILLGMSIHWEDYVTFFSTGWKMG